MQAVSAISAYHSKYGKYPEYIEATEKFLNALSQTVFAFQVPEEQCLIHRIFPTIYKTVRVRIIPLVE